MPYLAEPTVFTVATTAVSTLVAASGCTTANLNLNHSFVPAIDWQLPSQTPMPPAPFTLGGCRISIPLAWPAAVQNDSETNTEAKQELMAGWPAAVAGTRGLTDFSQSLAIWSGAAGRWRHSARLHGEYGREYGKPPYHRTATVLSCAHLGCDLLPVLPVSTTGKYYRYYRYYR
jgi:hypothetical protein